MNGSRVVVFMGIFLMGSGKFYTQVWVNPTPDRITSYIYAPGILMSEILMGRYCPKFIASTGEVVTCSKGKGIEVIGAPARGCNLSEISLKKTRKATYKAVDKACRDISYDHQAKQVFINVLLAPLCMAWYTVSYISNIVFGFTIERPKETEESLSMYWIDPTKINLAQESDVAIFKQTYNDFLAALNKEVSNKKSVVLYGTSRGSATIFNFTALEHPEQVSALICEGLFDSIKHLTAICSLWVNWFSLLLPQISQFDCQGIVPIKLVEQMPKNMPILLVTSRNDTTVPCECTINIYNKLRTTGHDHVHMVILQQASHNSFTYGNTGECKLYENVVHAFYKKYGLPYIAEYADKGEEYFMTMTQPTVGS